jgi:hypothetical protein
MGEKVPPWLGKHDDLDGRARYAAMTPNQRLACFEDICNFTDNLLRGRPDRRAVLARCEPMSAEAEKTWLRLVAEGRRGRDSQ